MLSTLFWLNLSLALGELMQTGLRYVGANLPFFVSLGVFLAMSLISLQLWTIVDVAGPIIGILAIQTILAVIFALFVISVSWAATTTQPSSARASPASLSAQHPRPWRT